MNCETIDSILDDHRLAYLSAADRQVVAAHLRGCARCADGWAANDALAGEHIAEPPPQLFAAVLGRLAAARARAPAERRRMWTAVVGAAAAVAAVAIVAARYSVLAPVPDADDAAPAVAAVLPAPRFVAGRDYEVLPGPVVAAATDRIEVVEFFMYECRPCYAFEPELTRWDVQARDYVSVVRVPAIFTPEAELHARAYYTAAALGKSDAMHAAFYEEIHERGNQLSSGGALAEWFASFGVAPDVFDTVFNSSEIDAQVQRAAALGRAYGIRATPSLVVAGRYSTNPGLAGSGSAVLAVVDELVAGEAARRRAARGVGGDGSLFSPGGARPRD